MDKYTGWFIYNEVMNGKGGSPRKKRPCIGIIIFIIILVIGAFFSEKH